MFFSGRGAVAQSVERPFKFCFFTRLSYAVRLELRSLGLDTNQITAHFGTL